MTRSRRGAGARGPGVGKARGLLEPLLAITAAVTLWELAYHTDVFDLHYFPSPSRFIAYLVEEGFCLGLGPDRSNVGVSILSSFGRVFVGLAFSFSLALATGAMVSLVPPVSRAVLPMVRLIAPIAPIAWIPMALILFGIGNKAAVALVFMGTYPILVVATVAAIHAVSPELTRAAATLGASPRQQWLFVVLPAALPSVFTALRINFIAAWMSVLAAEMVGLRDGLGAMILVGRESANPELILVGMTLIGLCGFAIDHLLLFVQRRFLWWGAGRT